MTLTSGIILLHHLKNKCNTNENTSRFRKKARKNINKERRKKNKSTNNDKSVERTSIQLDKYYNQQDGKIDYNDPMLVTPRSFNIGGQHSSKIFKWILNFTVYLDSSKIKNNMKETQDLFNSQVDKTVFDSQHSYSKYSSLGGTHTIEKKRRKLKNTASFKKKRGKPNSSKK